MSSGGDGLRDLAKKIVAVASNHREYSRVVDIIKMTHDHITMMAKVSDIEAAGNVEVRHTGIASQQEYEE